MTNKRNEIENRKVSKTVWIDLDNSPHVPFFIPIIHELKSKGYGVRITARDCSQTCELADLNQLSYTKVGRHYGKTMPVKIGANILRSVQLARALSHEERPVLALSHGSRAQTLSALWMGVPSIVLMDYEHVSGFVKPTWVMMPELISGKSMSINPGRVLKYHGIKEDVYVPLFKPDPIFREKFGFGDDEIIVTLRPPATEAHYHNAESEALFTAALDRMERMDRVRMVILPRYDSQKERILRSWRKSVDSGKIVIPDQVMEGLNLLWHSDLVISGGGTMNREAAALGVPVYSIFRGKIGAVDRWLQEKGRLVLIETVDDVHQKIHIQKRLKVERPNGAPSETLSDIVGHIENILNSMN